MLFSRALTVLPILLGTAIAVPAAAVPTDASISSADSLAITDLQSSSLPAANKLGTFCACSLLRAFFPSKVLFNGSAAYTTESTHFWDLRADLSPKCVFVPANTNDVARGVVILNVCQSQFAVRAGGHMPVPGAANTDGGVLVALSAFSTITLSADKNSVEAGPALNWYQMYSYLEPYGKIIVGGRLKTIGISGLTLGGGISYFSAKYGFGMDNVLAYEVVLSTGKVVTASATTNTDLFWGLKGGMGNVLDLLAGGAVITARIQDCGIREFAKDDLCANPPQFGIVTKFTFKTYSAPAVSTQLQVFGESSVPAYISAISNLANYQDQIDTGAGGVYTISSTPSTGQIQAQFLGVQIGNVLQPAVFTNFSAIPNYFTSYNVTTLAYWSSTLDTPYQISRNRFGTHAVLADEATLQAMYVTFKARSAEMAAIPGFSVNLVFQPITKSATTVAKTNGIGNTWGVDNTKAYVYWLITCQWSNAADDAAVTAWSDSALAQIHAANTAAGKAYDLIYLNDANENQNAFASLPAANLAKLKTIRKKYDPTLAFRNLATGGYKLD